MNVNYNNFEKVLHHLSLGNKIIKNTMFQLEAFFFKNKNYISEKIMFLFVDYQDQELLYF